MASLYDLLELSPTATQREIKKAYFKKVREFPPDDHAKAFMKIREAYETLSDENTRAAYDREQSMAAGARRCFQAAEQALRNGREQAALKILENAVDNYPDEIQLLISLGTAYLRNGNSGKSVKTLEKAMQLAPDNSSVVSSYARACRERGWHKKALAAYGKALQLDDDNYSLRLEFASTHIAAGDLSSARGVLLAALKDAPQRGWDETEILMELISMEARMSPMLPLTKHLDLIVALAQDTEQAAKLANALNHLACSVAQRGFSKKAALIASKAVALIASARPEIKALSDEEQAGFAEELVAISWDSALYSEFGVTLAKYLLPAELVEEDPEKEAELDLVREYLILDNFSRFREAILHVKTTYSRLYAAKAPFLEQALQPHLRRSLLKKRRSDKQMLNLLSEYLDKDEPLLDEDEDLPPVQEPIVRGPKVGRNDPCPCGSGKKYKKCCGR